MINYRWLKKYFLIAADYYSLGPNTRREAWEAALRDPEKAYRCYRAIARSL